MKNSKPGFGYPCFVVLFPLNILFPLLYISILPLIIIIIYSYITNNNASHTGSLNETCTWFVISGEYAGFDDSQPTAESGGKGRVISMLKEQYGFKTVVMIGDGATDLEACPPAVSVRSDCTFMHSSLSIY